jgi:hypothetical protein
MMTSLAVGSELDDENGDCGEQEDVNHAALMKNNVKDEPGQKKYRCGQPLSHLFFSPYL